MESNNVIAWAAVVQAVAALISAGVTIALWKATVRYANTADDALSALRDERTDRIRTARAPAQNAILQVREILDELDALVPGGDVEEVYTLRDALAQAGNALSHAASAITSAGPSRTVMAAASKVVSICSAIPRRPSQYEVAPTREQVAQLVRAAPPLVPEARRALAEAERILDGYIG